MRKFAPHPQSCKVQEHERLVECDLEDKPYPLVEYNGMNCRSSVSIQSTCSCQTNLKYNPLPVPSIAILSPFACANSHLYPNTSGRFSLYNNIEMFHCVALLIFIHNISFNGNVSIITLSIP